MSWLKSYLDSGRPLSSADIQSAIDPAAPWERALAETSRLVMLLAIAPLAAQIIVEAISGNGYAGAVMFALVFLHLTVLIGPKRAELRRHMAACRIAAGTIGPRPTMSMEQAGSAVGTLNRWLRHLAGIELVLTPILSAGAVVVLCILYARGAAAWAASLTVTLLMLLTIVLAMLNLKFAKVLRPPAGSPV